MNCECGERWTDIRNTPVTCSRCNKQRCRRCQGLQKLASLHYECEKCRSADYVANLDDLAFPSQHGVGYQGGLGDFFDKSDANYYVTTDSSGWVVKTLCLVKKDSVLVFGGETVFADGYDESYLRGLRCEKWTPYAFSVVGTPYDPLTGKGFIAPLIRVTTDVAEANAVICSNKRGLFVKIVKDIGANQEVVLLDSSLEFPAGEVVNVVLDYTIVGKDDLPVYRLPDDKPVVQKRIDAAPPKKKAVVVKINKSPKKPGPKPKKKPRAIKKKRSRKDDDYEGVAEEPEENAAAEVQGEKKRRKTKKDIDEINFDSDGIPANIDDCLVFPGNHKNSAKIYSVRYICNPDDRMCYAEVTKTSDGSVVVYLKHKNLGMLYTKVSYSYFGLSKTSVRSPKAVFDKLPPEISRSKCHYFI